MAWIRRRQERKATMRMARMLVALDGLAQTRALPRRTARASVGFARS
jgi:hypothetical protein